MKANLAVNVGGELRIDHPKWDRAGEVGIMLKTGKPPMTLLKYITDDATQRPLLDWTGVFLSNNNPIISNCNKLA